MTSTTVVDAIADILAKRWPDRLIYQNFCPKDFARPALFLWSGKLNQEDINIALVSVELELQLDIVVDVDDYHVSSTEDLRQDQAEVLALFAAPKTKVSNLGTGEERYIEIQARAEGQDPDVSSVLFTARWFDTRPGQGEMAPPMEHYTLRTGAAERKRNT